MSTATELTQDEKSSIHDAYDEAMNRGDFDAACDVARKLPIHRALVPFVKKYFSDEEIKKMRLIMPASGR
jgi:hypothetical protein